MKNLKFVYYIWGVLLAGFLAFALFADTDLPVVPIAAVILFGGAALFRSWKKSLVEIVVEEDAVHLRVMDGHERHIIPEGVTQIREINGGFGVRLKDGSDYHAKKGKFFIRTAEGEFTEFRPEDFPYAEFRKMK